MRSDVLCLPPSLEKHSPKARFTPTSERRLASNFAVKLVTRDSMKFCPRSVVFGLALLTSAAYTQTSRPPTSAMVTPKSDPGEASGNIEPVKPAITDVSADDSIAVDPSSLLPDLLPVPHTNATLVGGTLERLDRVRDRVVVRVFGGG